MSETASKAGLRRSRFRNFVLILLALAVIGVSSPARARADYSVVQCVPNSVSYTDAGSFRLRRVQHLGTNDCGGGHTGFASTPATSTPAGPPTAAGLAWRFTAAGGTNFTNANAVVHYGNDGGFAAASFSNGAPAFQVFATCATPASCWTTASANGGTIFEVRLQCFKSPNCHSDWAYAWTTNFAATVHDASAPAINAGGPLLGGGVVRGVQGLQAAATDSGGGARSVSIRVNGINSRGVDFCQPNYNGSYTALKPCPSSTSQPLAIDTQRDPGWTNGPNDVVICSSDVAGNVSAPCIRRTVQVDNSCPGSGGTSAADLEAGADIGGQLKARAPVTSNVQPVIRGALKDGAGTRWQGRRSASTRRSICPTRRANSSARPRRRDNGRFATRLEAGPSRRLDLVYRYNDKASRRESATRFEGRSDAQDPEEESSRMAKSARFVGRVPGPNADGRAVAMQARVGRKWRTFKQLRTEADGRFRGKYRFTQTRGRVRYVFRALVKRQSGYPYEPGASGKRKLIVRG